MKLLAGLLGDITAFGLTLYQATFNTLIEQLPECSSHDPQLCVHAVALKLI